jgi:hypothetical protein
VELSGAFISARGRRAPKRTNAETNKSRRDQDNDNSRQRQFKTTAIQGYQFKTINFRAGIKGTT